ncbi:restriction endonuclease subunit S [Wujia chipingensis]|uniref:Restriction endonuclease subunit S n=1 Tax=Wujia chipingensis TaxID=2763670 RepID=A0A7G9FKA7_9FIRM|nr:restriction endonuclease subunit S [Wujia chipingensis]QNL98988.1 restriction endonuclease subunit S [Wujia chipingensis]
MDIKALRQKILDLAIRGKLVPQDPNDEPASVLLERIRAEKQQMVKDGKLKPKDIKNNTIIFVGEDNLHYEKFQDGTVKCIEDEIPFELPEGWEWCRFTSVTVNRDSERKPISSANRTNVAKIYDYYGASGKIDKIDKFIFNEKLLLIGEDGANLVTRSKPIAFFAEGQYWVNNHAHCIDSTDKLILEYLCLYINAISLEKYVTGSAQPKMTQDNMNSILIALPPYEEQKRLEFQVNHILKTVSTIENEKEDIVNYIISAKSKILDLAIRGKLVPQDSNDEPASVLLERIRAEKEELIKQGKIKRDKKESIIFKGEDNSYYEKVGAEIRCIDSEIPFEIPDGWMYERLGNICSIARGGSPRPIENYLTDDENGLNWIKIGDTEQGGKYIYSTKEKIRPEGLSKTRYVCSGDFLLTNSMSFGRPYILRTNGCIHDGWLVIGGIEIAFHQDYLYYMLSSSIMYNALSSLAVGSTVKNLKSDSVKSLLVPIPPLAEQACISRQIENYFATMLPIERSLS